MCSSATRRTSASPSAFDVEGVDEHLGALPAEAFRQMIGRVRADYPGLQRHRDDAARGAARPRATTGARLPGATAQFYEATPRPDLEILDRVGGGDSFASGLIYGFLPARSGTGPSNAAPRMARWR